jgi:hypothetical protein
MSLLFQAYLVLSFAVVIKASVFAKGGTKPVLNGANSRLGWRNNTVLLRGKGMVYSFAAHEWIRGVPPY